MKKYTRDFEEMEVVVYDNMVTLSVASAEPYERYEKQIGTYDEILVISDEAIDFKRLVDERCPFLYQHDTDKQIGVVEKAYIMNDKLYVDVRFSDSDFAQQVLSDIRSGIRRNTSIGYSVDDYKLTETAGSDKLTMYVTKWTPFECSSVSCPADATVGYQRSLDTKTKGEKDMKKFTDEELEKFKALLKACEEDEEKSKKEDEEAAEEAAAEEEAKAKKEEGEATEEQEGQEEEKAKKECEEDEEKECDDDEEEIRSLGDLLNKRDMAEEFIKNKRSLKEFKDAIKSNNTLNVKEVNMEKQFSLRKALLNAAGKLSDEEAKFEREIIAENKRKFNVNDADIVLTKDEIRAFNGLEALNQTVYQPGLYAGVLRAPVTKDFVGTRKVAVNGPSISFSVATSGINAGYVDINGDVPSATMDFSLKQLTPKKAGAYVDVSYQSLLQDDPSAEAVIMEDITKALAQVQDDAFFNGEAGNNEPVGLLNTSGINTVTLPATPTLSTALEFEKKIRESNDYSADLKWVFGTDAYYKWASTPYSATEQNKMLLDDETRKCIGYDCFIDHNIPASSVILGNFSEALEADFDGITIKIVTEDKTLARKQAIEIIAYAANDYVFRRPKSFTVGE